MSRTPLRRRALATTVLYGLMLIGITLFLSWRANVTQQEIQRLVTVDSRAAEVLDEIVRNQNGYRQQWLASAGDSPKALSEITARYASLMQLVDTPALEQLDLTQLRRQIHSFEETVDRGALGWPTWPPSWRNAYLRELENESGAIVRTASFLRDRTRQRMENDLALLAREGRSTMWTAVAVAYIVAVISFAGARMMLGKVVKPLEDLARAAESIAAGDYSARAPIAGDREIAQLGQSFNEMASRIAATVDATEQRARTDELTSMPNFRAFREALGAEMERSDRYEYSFGLLVFDLDKFKKYNDTYGHLAGNDALRAVAAAIRASLRAVDFPARYGGEEFAAILPQLDEEGLAITAERIRRAVEAIPAIEGRSRLTVSIGGALYPSDGRSPEELFQIADERLYSAKQGGRNRVVTPGSPRARRRPATT